VATLYFPYLAFHEGENVTVRMGKDWAELFGGGIMEADIKQIGNPALFAVADLSRVDCVPFNLVQQEWIDEASYLNVDTLDDLYNFLSLFYGTFDGEEFVSVLYFTLRS
jgi:hypothetical protein